MGKNQAEREMVRKLLPIGSPPQIMKTIQTFLVGLALLGGLTSAGHAQMAPEAPQALAPSLADQLPADTLIYLEIPDIASLREGISQSSLGKIYEDPELQAFLAEGLSLLDEQWENLRGMSAGMGIPEGLTYWDALKSLELGLAVRANPAVENPFSAEPQIYAMLSVGLGEGLGQPVFQLLTMYGEGGGLELIGSEEGDILFADFGEGTAEISLQGDAIVAKLIMGAKGEGSLSSDARFQTARSHTVADGAVVFGYLQWNSIFETLLKGLQYEAPQFHGPATRFYERALKPLDSIAFASGWNESGTFTNVRVGMNGDGDGLYASSPADLDLLKFIPSDATNFFVRSEATALGPFFMETIDDFASVEVEGMVLKDGLAMEAPEVHAWLFGEKRPELDAAVAGFGSRSFGYGTSMGMQSESLMFSELTDGPAVTNMLVQLMPRLREMLDQTGAPVRLDMKRVKQRVKQEDGTIETVPGAAYYMVDFTFMDEMPPQLSALTGAFQPTFGVTEDNWLVFSMSKQPVRRVLMNGFEVPEENITANPDVQGFLAKVNDSTTSLAWSDPRPAVDAAAGMAVGMMPMLLGMAGGEMDLPFDAEKVPSAELFSRHLRPSESISWMGEGESMFQHVGSFGVADMFTVFGACASVGPPVAMMFMAESQSHPHELETVPAPDHEEEF